MDLRCEGDASAAPTVEALELQAAEAEAVAAEAGSEHSGEGQGDDPARASTRSGWLTTAQATT